MIITKLMGGLGNQMFQYAAGRHLAHINNTELKTDLSFLQKDAQGAYTQRAYALDIFTLKSNFASDAEVSFFQAIANNRYKRFLFRKFPFLFNKAYITESGTAYHSDFTKYPANTFLSGFWQSEKYFAPVANIIRNDFSFKNAPEGLNKELAGKIASVNSVSLHIRRSDYIVNEKVLNYHGVCPPSYYFAGVEKLKQKEPNLHLFIFSDDIPWCKQNLVFDLPCTYIEHNTGNNSFEDMRLMSLCKHNIIANSSFSWWGAWLNNNPQKTVIAPEKWFADKSKQSPDIYPDNWIRL